MLENKNKNNFLGVFFLDISSNYYEKTQFTKNTQWHNRSYRSTLTGVIFGFWSLGFSVESLAKREYDLPQYLNLKPTTSVHHPSLDIFPNPDSSFVSFVSIIHNLEWIADIWKPWDPNFQEIKMSRFQGIKTTVMELIGDIWLLPSIIRGTNKYYDITQCTNGLLQTKQTVI